MTKVYEKPRVIFAEKVEARAVGCLRLSATDPACSAGPIQS